MIAPNNQINFNQLAALNMPTMFNPPYANLPNAQPVADYSELNNPQSVDYQETQFSNPITSGLRGAVNILVSAIKSYVLLGWALGLVLLGVYLITRSTPEGKAVIGAVTKV